jgi:hypothetical protein
MRWASNSTDAWGRQAAITSGPNVRFGTKRPSITSHWIRSTPAASRAATSSPSFEKSAGSTDGAISIGRSVPGRSLIRPILARRPDRSGDGSATDHT